MSLFKVFLTRTVRFVGAASMLAIAFPALGSAETPAPTEACQALAAAAATTLGATPSVTAGPVSYPGLAEASGCNIAFAGTGEVYGTSFQAVAAKLDALMVGRGWAPDLNAQADGPTGTAAGYRMSGQAVAVSVNYDTAPGVCRADAPVADCHPTPVQMTYTITLGLMPTS